MQGALVSPEFFFSLGLSPPTSSPARYQQDNLSLSAVTTRVIVGWRSAWSLSQLRLTPASLPVGMSK